MVYSRTTAERTRKMTRKKITSDADAINAIPELGDNEQIVIEDTKRIRREKAPAKPEPPPEPESYIDVEPLGDDDDDDAPPQFSETSLAALIYDGDDDNFTNQFCTVAVRRKPDKMRDSFLTPCSSVLNYPALANIEITTDRSDIEEIVRQQYGGGHYFFQIRFNNRLARSWESSLADLPEAIAAAKAEKTAPIPTTAPQPAPAEPSKDPMDAMLDNLTKMKLLRDALFGDERARMERQIDELKREIEARPEPAPATPLPENLQILEKALATNNPTLQEKLLDYAFPQDGGGHWIPETLKMFFEHKDEIGAILGGLLGGIAPKPQPQGIDALLRAAPPTPMPNQPPIAPSKFQRKKVAKDPDGENADAGSEQEAEKNDDV